MNIARHRKIISFKSLTHTHAFALHKSRLYVILTTVCFLFPQVSVPEAKLLLSALAIAVANTGCPIPVFSQVGHGCDHIMFFWSCLCCCLLACLFVCLFVVCCLFFCLSFVSLLIVCLCICFCWFFFFLFFFFFFFGLLLFGNLSTPLLPSAPFAVTPPLF